ncbi:glycosyltransferase [Limoniibacter endophyticus]|uniref:Glycosyl transferase n=1 Tax=Limoniibacter endophyticus TaxID=1565040 RepID=A0A8J3DHA3_9HYPH|nr:glycosyltransferase family 4 protein [Limoniibacter endophyticus]GHC67599.1 glycosyl transferase [Limoniibacter endophyticus]
MHLVFATSLVPHETATSGYEIANQAIIDGLRRLGCRVTVLGYGWPGHAIENPDETVLLGELELRTHVAGPREKLKWLFTALAKGLTFSSAKLQLRSLDKVREALDKIGPFDGFIANAAQFAGAYEGLFAGKPTIFVAHNVEHISAQQNADAAKSILEQILYRREARLLKALEERLCANADFVFTLAEEDRAELGVDSPARSITLPLVVGRQAPASRGAAEIIRDVGLIGTWTWQPNRIGLEWFLNHVVPLLDKSVRVEIAGTPPHDLVTAHPRVKFIGRVPDATQFVTSSRLMALTSRVGTGVQLKTIETFELGVPAVATPSSLRGISYLPGNCRVADDAKSFAAAIGAMMGDAPRADGSTFYESQRDALDRALLLGLDVASEQRGGGLE